MMVSGQDRTIMETNVMIRVTRELIVCGMLWLISWRSVSISFV